ncbi:hypothetical protein LM524_09080 [Pediococcus pentosaceus]|nr:hypothetical protein [Pediococcus pentosaceus]
MIFKLPRIANWKGSKHMIFLRRILRLTYVLSFIILSISLVTGVIDLFCLGYDFEIMKFCAIFFATGFIGTIVSLAVMAVIAVMTLILKKED